MAHREEFLEKCIGAIFPGGDIFRMSIEPLLHLLEQGEREKAKTDGVYCDSLDGNGATHLHEVLEMCIHVLMGLPTEWVGLHHIDQCRLELKLGIP